MIKVGFSTTESWISKVIRKLTKSKTSHTFILFQFASRWWVVEASWTGVRITSWESFRSWATVVALVDLPTAHNIDLADVLDTVGSPYDFKGLFGMLWVYAGRLVKQTWQNPLASSKALFCSEMAVKLLQNSGYPDSHLLEASNTSPDDLLKFMTR